MNDESDEYPEVSDDDKANNPTRAEYLDLYLDLEIGKARDSMPLICRRTLISLLTTVRERVNWTFRDDDELIKLSGKGTPGVKKGSSRLTKQAKYFALFRKEFPHCRDYNVYERWCNDPKNKVPEDGRYTPLSFAEKLSRERSK